MKKILLIISSFLITANVFADQPKDWQFGLQNPASDGMMDFVSGKNPSMKPTYDECIESVQLWDLSEVEL